MLMQILRGKILPFFPYRGVYIITTLIRLVDNKFTNMAMVYCLWCLTLLTTPTLQTLAIASFSTS